MLESLFLSCVDRYSNSSETGYSNASPTNKSRHILMEEIIRKAEEGLGRFPMTTMVKTFCCCREVMMRCDEMLSPVRRFEIKFLMVKVKS